MKKEKIATIGLWSFIGAGAISLICQLNDLELASNLFSMFSVIVALICFVLYKVKQSVEKKALSKEIASLIEEAQQTKQATTEMGQSILPKVRRFYQELLRDWNRPEQILHIEMLQDDILYPVCLCDCWVDNIYLNILEQFYTINEKVLEHPTWYETDEKMKLHIVRAHIQLSDIHNFRVCGDVFKTTEFQAGELPSQYIGVSVNGIGFGEVRGGTPARITQRISDNRKVVLFYKEQDSPTLQKIYFTYESYEALIQVIPDKERTEIGAPEGWN